MRKIIIVFLSIIALLSVSSYQKIFADEVVVYNDYWSPAVTDSINSTYYSFQLKHYQETGYIENMSSYAQSGASVDAGYCDSTFGCTVDHSDSATGYATTRVDYTGLYPESTWQESWPS